MTRGLRMPEGVEQHAFSQEGFEAFNPDKRIETHTNRDSTTNGYNPDLRIESSKGIADLSVSNDGSELPSETKSGRQVYVDEANKAYRIDDELVPNNEYVINGYEYKTDDLGRITSAEGQVSLRSRERSPIKDSMDTIGKGSQLETDDRGHLIADRFNGGNGMENIVPMDGELNKGAFKKLENRLADAVKDGCDVSYKVEPRYSDDSRRPSSFVVTDIIDGETTVTVFKNEGTATRE